SQIIYYSPQNNYSINSLLDSMTRRSDFRGYTLNRLGITRALEKMTEPQLTNRAMGNLERQYPEFGDRMREFRDGILLFKAEDQEVWSKLKFDSTLARYYYDTTSARYRTETKYDISEIYVLTDTMANDIRRSIDNGGDFAQLAAQNTMREGAREKKGNIGLVAAREHKLAAMVHDRNATPGTIIGPIAIDKGFTIVRVNRVEPARVKTFEEAIPELAPAFQDQLQKNLTEKWLSEVRSRHQVKVEIATLNDIFMHSPKK
ncbi:MAG TPA: peptidyl-prolyl cis-trans isomerase, partial [Patescibacteria group bacterium]|nr:peptidyl-prolyl cis-trans isomerase [Patescibacteria group bacterium]